MSLSRSGFDLNEIWAKQAELIEMDTRLRDLSRSAAGSGTHEDWTKWAHHKVRAGEGEALAHRLGRTYLASSNLLDRAQVRRWKSEKGDDKEGAEKSTSIHERAQAAHENHAKRLRYIGERLGRSAGTFVPTKPLEHRSYELSQHEHVLALARLHRHDEQGGIGTQLGPHGESHFRKPKDARDFHAAMQHHYPNAQTTSRDTFERREDGPGHGHTRVSWRRLP